MVEHHFAGTLKGRKFHFFNHIRIHMRLVQDLVILGYFEGLDCNSHIQTCTFVDPLLRKIIQQNVFQTFQNLVDIPGSFLKGWNIPGAPAKAIMSDSLGRSQSIHMERLD